MKALKTSLLVCLISISIICSSQEQDKSPTLSLFTGGINYQGDLQPNSFIVKHSNIALGIIFRKPLNRWFTLRAGATTGKIKAADRWNRDNLKSRNLNFSSNIKEAYIGLEVNILDLSSKRFSPYFYGAFAAFHFNPYTYDNAGVKTYLKPLSTEGQGLSQYPEKKPYSLTQFALAFGGGARVAVTDELTIGLELSQRKSFTDYIDDVSSSFVDRNILLQEKGPKAVELSYRADELSGGRPIFPTHGDQRGTPSEMDWYYFFGLTMEMKISGIADLFVKGNRQSLAKLRCPRL
jgi:hypothetical protein